MASSNTEPANNKANHQVYGHGDKSGDLDRRLKLGLQYLYAALKQKHTQINTYLTSLQKLQSDHSDDTTTLFNISYKFIPAIKEDIKAIKQSVDHKYKYNIVKSDPYMHNKIVECRKEIDEINKKLAEIDEIYRYRPAITRGGRRRSRTYKRTRRNTRRYAK